MIELIALNEKLRKNKNAFDGDISLIYELIESLTNSEIQQAKQILDDCEKYKVSYFSILDERYPTRLRDLKNPPLVLFYQGNFELLNKPSITIVGSRSNTSYGQSCTDYFVGKLSSSYTIVSGFAYGIDYLAHKSCFDHGGCTIGVSGCGLNIAYPSGNQGLKRAFLKTDRGLFLSEYPPMQVARKEFFPYRNRLLAALSESIFVIESALKSGTMHTVFYANELGREIFALPGSILNYQSEGPNYLISQGATPLTKAIFSERFVKDAIVESFATDDNILLTLSKSPKSINELLMESELDINELIARLSEYEMCGILKCNNEIWMLNK